MRTDLRGDPADAVSATPHGATNPSHPAGESSAWYEGGRLERCAHRARAAAGESRCTREELDELREAGFLSLPVPVELGGAGMELAPVCRELRRLAYHAAAAARGVYHHLALAGTAAELARQGDDSLRWMLHAASSGLALADGHAEPGNDIPLLYSSTTAEPVEGGYRLTGRKCLDGATPHWDYLRVCGMDLSRTGAARMVHALLARGDAGYRAAEVRSGVPWMAHDGGSEIVLEGAFIPHERVASVVSPGLRGVNTFVVALLTWTRLGEAAIYCSMARRMADLTILELRRETSIALSRSPMIYHPGAQCAVAEMVIELECLEPHLERMGRDWSRGVGRDDGWLARTAVARDRAMAAARRVAGLAVEARGSTGTGAVPELGRLVRDSCMAPVLSCEGSLTREMVAKAALGLDFDEQPRWG